MTLRLVAIRLPRTLWQRINRRSVWLRMDGSLELRGFSARAVCRWYKNNVIPPPQKGFDLA